MKKNAWAEAQKHLAGGVNSPVRAFKAVGGEPIFMQKGLGPYLFDVNENCYVDYCLSWGAILLGHAAEDTVKAIQAQAVNGTSFGTATEYETALAVEIKKAFPGMERIRFTSSGTEAVMSAIRLARGATRRDRILKFEGCYHGHADSLLVKAGSGLATFGMPDSLGIPATLAEKTSVLPYNDSAAVREFFKKNRDVACVIVEPVAGNMGVVPATQKFLETLRKETAAAGSLLIFDEVITGYRLTYGGAQHLAGIRPDLTVLGKIIGGGLPVGAFGGTADLMNLLSPNGAVYQAGTLSGNPLSMAAGLSVLRRLTPGFYKDLNSKTSLFLKTLRATFKKKGERVTVQSAGSMFTVFFTGKPVQNYADVMEADRQEFARHFRRMLKGGVYIPPSAFEASFVSGSHGPWEFEKTLRALA